MCNPASFIVVKENGGLRCLWHPDVSDSHEDIIDFYKLKEINVREEITLVRVEITPPKSDYTLPLGKWEYELDQDILPSWYDEAKVEAECRLELVAWLAAKVVLPGEVREKVEGKTHLVVVYGTISRVYGSATISRVSGSAKIGVCTAPQRL
jgi:hypothetical protein